MEDLEIPSENEEIVRDALKKVAKDSAFIFMGIVLARLFGFFRQLIVIRLLPPDDYGLFTLGMTVIALYILFSSLGLPSGAQRYIAFYWGKGDEGRTRGVIVSTILMLAASVVVVMIIAIVVAKPIASLFEKPDLSTVLIWLLPLVPLAIFIDAVTSLFLGFHRVGVKVFLQNIGLYLVSLVSVALMLSLRRQLSSLLAAMVISYTLVALGGLLYAWRKFPLHLGGKERVSEGKELLLFSLPLLVAIILNYLIMHTDTLMLGYYLSSDLVGIYNAAFVLVQILAIFLGSVASIYMPVASSMYALGHHLEIRRLYRSTTKWLFIFTLPLFLIFFMFPSDVLGLVFGGVYPTASTALQLLCLGEFLHTLLGPNAMTLLAYGKSRVLMIDASLAAVNNIVLNALFIPRWGINGAAAASFISLILVNILNSGYLYFKYHVHPFGWDYLKPVVLLVAVSSALYLPLSALLRTSSWFLLAYYPLFLAIGLALLVLSKSIEPSDRALIDAIRARFRAGSK